MARDDITLHTYLTVICALIACFLEPSDPLQYTPGGNRTGQKANHSSTISN